MMVPTYAQWNKWDTHRTISSVLDIANKLYVESMYKFIGRDGQQYSTTEQLRAADKRYEETMFPKIEKENQKIRKNSNCLFWCRST